MKKITHTLSKAFFSFTKDKQSIHITLLLLSLIALVYVILQILAQPLDDRASRIDAYYTSQGAPLAGYGQTFVRAADRCGMDWRLLPAIAMQESTGGKRIQYNNPFGWGSAEIPFDSFEEAIIHVGKHICGDVSTTAQWYDTTSTYEKLWWYNGTVAPTYPDEVMWIMDQI